VEGTPEQGTPEQGTPEQGTPEQGTPERIPEVGGVIANDGAGYCIVASSILAEVPI